MRIVFGVLAAGIYGWRIDDPKGSYIFFYDTADWLTNFLLAPDGISGVFRNLINLILLDQVDGFLLGVLFFSLISLCLWPFRALGRLCVRKVKEVLPQRTPKPDEGLAIADFSIAGGAQLEPDPPPANVPPAPRPDRA
ncbi:MAG: hypothetical protein ACKVGZ_05355 [Alphaproteobacteria bacterium]|jgi:hypothetical protein